MTLELRITIGDLLTSATIVISAVTLAYQLAKDRSAKQTEQANEVRTAAARTLEGLTRWRDISMSFFDELQPVFVQTSQELAKSRQPIQARDYLYKEIRVHHLDRIRGIQKEGIRTAYIPMYKYNPSIKAYFETLTAKMTQLDQETLDALLAVTEKAVMGTRAEHFAETAILGNRLREVSQEVKGKQASQTTQVLTHAEEFLGKLVSLPDRDLLDSQNLAAPSERRPGDPR